MKKSVRFNFSFRIFALAWLLVWTLGSLMARTWKVEYSLPTSLLSPSMQNGFGTDVFGRSVLILTLRAASSSLLLSLLSTMFVFAAGIFICAVSLFSPKWIRFCLMRGLEFFLAIPSILIALAFAAVRGPGWVTLFIALIIGALPGFLRLILSRADELLLEPYVLASQSIGTPPSRVFVRHLLPALLSYASVKIPNLLASALMAEAALSFMGIGAPIGTESWGLLLVQGRDYLIEAPHIAIISGAPLILTTLAFQSLSEQLFQSLPNQVKLLR